jgi:uncharacterized repeat protein (TIGR01451 family)
MRAPQTPAKSRPATNALQVKTQVAKPAKRSSFKTARYALLILFLLAAGTLAAMPGSSAATSKRATRADNAAAQSQPAAAHAALRSREAERGSRGMSSSLPLLPAFFQAEPLTVYAADCTTPQTSFSLGDTVCVKVSGQPVGLTPLRRVTFSNTAGSNVGTADVTTSSQTFMFTIPSSATTGDVDNRGNWTVGIVETSEATLMRAVFLTVHDPDQQVADLTISKIALSDDFVAGTDVSYQIYIWNRGPDAAQNAHFTDNTLPNTTFVSLTQNSGPAFTCTSPGAGTAGTSNCTRGTSTAPLDFNMGDTAVFTAVYHVNATVSNDTELDDTATVGSSTYDSAPSSDTYDVTTTATNPNPPPCTISCPSNITQDSDPGQAGAIVNYDAPTTSGTCQPVTIDRPSGSFFPIGPTTVNASAGTGVSCSFTVTVIDKRSVAVTLNGSADMTVECRTGFSDPGATATDGTNPLDVTMTVTVPDPGGATDSNGDAVQIPTAAVNPNSPNTYTITYTATDSNGHTGKATRVVHVVDTAPPVITLAGISGFTPQTETVTVTNDDGTTSTVTETILVGTVECHSAFTAPTATAFDGCDNHTVDVTISGGVNANVPGVYEIVYAATDASSNDTEQRVRVTVVDTTPPIITLNGASPMTVECHTSFTDPGATAFDSCDANSVPVSASGSVNPDVVGTYSITYTASDSGGRTATVVRTVNVVDTTAPLVTLNGPSAVTVECHTVYTDAGASASDSCAGSVSLSSTSDVNVNAPGTYHVVWSATDPSGNTGTATRTVTVVDTIPPTMTLNSYAPSMWPPNHKYSTFRVTDFVTAVSDSCNTALGVDNVVIEKVTSDEPDNGGGDGDTANDMVIAADCKSVQLRSERNGSGDGRVYIITFKVSDGTNVTRKTAKVIVPHDQGHGGSAVDSGVHNTVNGSCP